MTITEHSLDEAAARLVGPLTRIADHAEAFGIEPRPYRPAYRDLRPRFVLRCRICERPLMAHGLLESCYLREPVE